VGCTTFIRKDHPSSAIPSRLESRAKYLLVPYAVHSIMSKEARVGWLTKIAKKSRLPVRRFFYFDQESGCLLCYHSQEAIKRYLDDPTYSLENLRLSGREVRLSNCSVGQMQHNCFSVFLNDRSYPELTIFPWFRHCLEDLYGLLKTKDSKRSPSALVRHSLIKQSKEAVLTGLDSVEIRENIFQITLPNGHTYCGEVNELGLPHTDAGREFFEDGSIYYGGFREGKWHGFGCIINSNLDLDIEFGEFIDGSLCGI